MSTISLVKRACDYCGKPEHRVGILIVGLNDGAICDACVEVCVALIAKSRAEQDGSGDEVGA